MTMANVLNLKSHLAKKIINDFVSTGKIPNFDSMKSFLPLQQALVQDGTWNEYRDKFNLMKSSWIKQSVLKGLDEFDISEKQAIKNLNMLRASQLKRARKEFTNLGLLSGYHREVNPLRVIYFKINDFLSNDFDDDNVKHRESVLRWIKDNVDAMIAMAKQFRQEMRELLTSFRDMPSKTVNDGYKNALLEEHELGSLIDSLVKFKQAFI